MTARRLINQHEITAYHTSSTPPPPPYITSVDSTASNTHYSFGFTLENKILKEIDNNVQKHFFLLQIGH